MNDAARLHLGWKQTKGGTHHCHLCHEFVQATGRRPVWLYWADNRTATMAVCGPCAKAALKPRALA